MSPPVLDPQIQAVLEEQAAAGAQPPGSLTPEELRAQYVKQCKEQWGELDVDRIGVGGDSAGGNLAAVVARRGRDHAIPIALQLLLYPVINHAFDTPSYSFFSQGYGLTRDGMQWFWEQYLGEGGDGSNPDASPSQAGDLRRLPRAIVVTAEADVLRDEAESYAQRLFLSTVETEGYRYDGMVHGFLRMAGKVERSNAAFDELAPSIRAMLAKTWRD